VFAIVDGHVVNVVLGRNAADVGVNVVVANGGGGGVVMNGGVVVLNGGGGVVVKGCCPMSLGWVHSRSNRRLG